MQPPVSRTPKPPSAAASSAATITSAETLRLSRPTLGRAPAGGAGAIAESAGTSASSGSDSGAGRSTAIISVAADAKAEWPKTGC